MPDRDKFYQDSYQVQRRSSVRAVLPVLLAWEVLSALLRSCCRFKSFTLLLLPFIILDMDWVYGGFLGRS